MNKTMVTHRAYKEQQLQRRRREQPATVASLRVHLVLLFVFRHSGLSELCGRFEWSDCSAGVLVGFVSMPSFSFIYWSRGHGHGCRFVDRSKPTHEVIDAIRGKRDHNFATTGSSRILHIPRIL